MELFLQCGQVYMNFSLKLGTKLTILLLVEIKLTNCNLGDARCQEVFVDANKCSRKKSMKR